MGFSCKYQISNLEKDSISLSQYEPRLKRPNVSKNLKSSLNEGRHRNDSRSHEISKHFDTICTKNDPTDINITRSCAEPLSTKAFQFDSSTQNRLASCFEKISSVYSDSNDSCVISVHTNEQAHKKHNSTKHTNNLPMAQPAVQATKIHDAKGDNFPSTANDRNADMSEALKKSKRLLWDVVKVRPQRKALIIGST